MWVLGESLFVRGVGFIMRFDFVAWISDISTSCLGGALLRNCIYRVTVRQHKITAVTFFRCLCWMPYFAIILLCCYKHVLRTTRWLNARDTVSALCGLFYQGSWPGISWTSIGFNGRLANRGLTSLVKRATAGVLSLALSQGNVYIKYSLEQSLSYWVWTIHVMFICIECIFYCTIWIKYEISVDVPWWFSTICFVMNCSIYK